MRTSELKGGGDVTIPSERLFSLTMFFFTSMLADALRSMDVSHSPDSLILYSRFPYHVPPARVLVCSRFRLACFLTCTVLDRRLVTG